MPHFCRPYRYSPPAAATLRKSSANHKVTKMLPNRHHPSRAALRANAQHPRVADTYRLPYDATSFYPDQYTATYGSHGERERTQRGYGGEEEYYGRQPGRGSWAAEPQPGWHGGHDYRDDRQGGIPTTYEVQPQVPQQGQYYQEVRPVAASGQQYGTQASYYHGVPSAAPAWQGSQQDYWRGYQQAYNPASQYRRQDFYPPAYSQTYYGQQAEYVPTSGWQYQQPSQYSYGYQQQPHLTQDWHAANNLHPNAPTFQPQTANRVPPTPIDNFIPSTASRQDVHVKSASRSTTPHLHILKRPVPSPEYLKNANQSVEALETPRQLLVVLDLNGTLLFRKARGGTAFVARPKVNEFIHYLLEHHRVMVWSSAKPENVDPMCKKLFDKEQYQRLVAVWARDTLRIPPHAYSSKVQCYKQLSWIWNDKRIQASSNSDATAVWDQSNTVLIDDSVEKAASEPHNLICLEEFKDLPDQQQSDVLGQVVKYLEMLKFEKDVSAFMHLMPFTYNPGEEFDWKV